MMGLLIQLLMGLAPMTMGDSVDESEKTERRMIVMKFVETYWSGQFVASDLEYVSGSARHLEVKIVKSKTIDKKGTSIHLCANSQVEFVGRMVWSIEAKSAGCKVGDLEAVEGTTIEFWESEDNLLRSIVTAKPVKMRSHTWPAKSQLLFYFYDKGGLMLYAAVLGSDLKGTKYKAGQKVYIGSIRDSDAEQTDTLSLYGEDPTL